MTSHFIDGALNRLARILDHPKVPDEAKLSEARRTVRLIVEHRKAARMRRQMERDLAAAMAERTDPEIER